MLADATDEGARIERSRRMEHFGRAPVPTVMGIPPACGSADADFITHCSGDGKKLLSLPFGSPAVLGSLTRSEDPLLCGLSLSAGLPFLDDGYHITRFGIAHHPNEWEGQAVLHLATNLGIGQDALERAAVAGLLRRIGSAIGARDRALERR